MWKLCLALSLACLVGGCTQQIPALGYRMQPASAAVAARRRPLTEAERDKIEAAVTPKLVDVATPEFRWAPLILRGGRTLDYCGTVAPAVPDLARPDETKYFAKLNFDAKGALQRVDAVKTAKRRPSDLPTEVDSLCNQADYYDFAAVR